MNIDAIIDGIVKREGGFVDHTNDRGGPTCWGITEAVARMAGYKGPMQTMPQQIARDIYLDRYWTAPKLDRVAALSPAIAEELADTGVNMGPATAVTALQRALNVLNQQTRLYPDLKPDGGIGLVTLAALKAFLQHRGADGERVLLTALNCLQGCAYIEIAEKRPTQEDFVFGWLRERVRLT
jgi:lysozyme family protein